MKYSLTATANPQDFFNGIEPEGLGEFLLTDDLEQARDFIFRMAQGGYCVIIRVVGEH